MSPTFRSWLKAWKQLIYTYTLKDMLYFIAIDTQYIFSMQMECILLDSEQESESNCQ